MAIKGILLVSIFLFLLGDLYSQDTISKTKRTPHQLPDSLIVVPDTATIMDIHPQDSPEDKGLLIESKDQTTSLRIRGSIRLSGAYDLNGLQSKSTFSTYDIPVGENNSNESRFFMSINQSRVGLEAAKQTSIGEVFMRMEMDFMGANSVPRLRHIYGSTGKWLAGQTWSVFSDVSSIPNTVDLDGPNSSVAERTVQIRFNNKFKNNMGWAVSIESPSPDISKPDSVQREPAFQSFPDIAGRFRSFTSKGHVQVAGIIRSISVKDTANENTYKAGFGVLVSGKYSVGKKSKILFQGFFGSAISRYITSLTGKGLDVVYNPGKQDFETITSMGGFISYGIDWTKNLDSYFTAGITNIINKDFQADDFYNYSGYFSGNLFWNTKYGTRVGVEYAFGNRVNKDIESGNANRISFIFYYDF